MAWIVSAPKSLCVIGMASRVALEEGSGNFERWHLAEGPQVTGGVSLQRTVRSWSLLSLYLLAMR